MFVLSVGLSLPIEVSEIRPGDLYHKERFMPVPQEWNLTGKVALITSDRRGWTPFLAAALAEAGAKVAVAGSENSDAVDAIKAIEDHGGKGLAITTDVTNSKEVDVTINKVISIFGKIDILVNNARVEFGKPFKDVTETEWRTIMEFNVNSMFLFCRAVGKYMLAQGEGRIINISSGLAVRGLWNSVAACASQGAIHQLTSSLALEWGRKNIKVNAIGAGWLTLDEPKEEDQEDILVRYLPSRRKGHPRDLCGLLVYLASDADGFVTGQTIFIDGGALAHG